MYWVDIITILVAVILIYKSYQQGLLNSAFRLAGLVLGIIIAANLGAWASDILIMQFSWTQQVADIVGYIAIFIIVILIAQIIGYFLRTIIHAIKLGWLDKIGGLFLGALKAAIIMSLIFWVLMAIPSDSLGEDIKDKSFSYKLLGGFAPALYEKLVQPNLNEGGMRERLDSLLSPNLDSLNIIGDFEDELENIKGTDQEFLNEMKARFIEIPLSKKMEVMNKLSEENPDLQEIINILYTETP
ncbi:MAG: CvpA family protein [Candidatus Marinimicrobia bacterium]|nr:CvpA family protein [Candidatus Neomarinimicrobiota bacterium]